MKKQLLLFNFILFCFSISSVAQIGFNNYQTAHDCNGGGCALTISEIDGGNAGNNYTVTITDGTSTTSSSITTTSYTFSNLNAGIYTIEVTDNISTTTSTITLGNAKTYDPSYSLANLGGILILNLKDDFCAEGDGITNDVQSLYYASEFIKKRGGHVKLFIPAGTYLLDGQNPPANSTSDMLGKFGFIFDDNIYI